MNQITIDKRKVKELVKYRESLVRQYNKFRDKEHPYAKTIQLKMSLCNHFIDLLGLRKQVMQIEFANRDSSPEL